jgi:hypothetical protein
MAWSAHPMIGDVHHVSSTIPPRSVNGNSRRCWLTLRPNFKTLKAF